MTKKKIEFSPFTRVEGDLSLEVEVADGAVSSARAAGTLFRGFEQMLRGRRPRDAVVMLCRICGQCGGAHSTAAAAALSAAWGASVPRNAALVRALIQATETILSHLAHFECSFAGDLCSLPGCGQLEERFAPIRGRSFRRALRARKVLLGLMGLLAGKWPNTLAIQPGGVTRTLNQGELIRARGILAEFVRHLEECVLACPVAEWLGNRSLSDLEGWLNVERHRQGDLGQFVGCAMEHGLDRIGRGPGRFISAGGFRLPGGQTSLRSGYWEGGVAPFRSGNVTEDVTYSWYESDGGGARPQEQRSVPAADKEEAYSWSKAPRYGGKSAEVGPMARMLIDGDPLATDLVDRLGPSVFTRVVLRLHEVVRMVPEMKRWLGQIDPEAPFYREVEPLADADGCAMTEAPRGTLGHWVRLRQGRIRNYQVVTPTSWNLSPRDADGAPGPLEEALEGTPVRDPETAVNVALVVRSYDPCLYCSVH
ncbi:MAG: nickel-dependent hydrogenase large subunit [Planctomycetota bacterium]